VVKKSDKPAVITTNSMIADIVRNVAGEFVTVESIMPPGIDPHQYKASEGDVVKLAGADLIFHNGLSLEGKLGKVLERTQKQVLSYPITQYMPRDQFIVDMNTPDPHVWFDPQMWVYAINCVADALVQIDPANTLYYRKNEETYIRELLQLNENSKARLDTVPMNKRILITSHNAFRYFGRAYGWEVLGVQGMNTNSETSVYSIQALADTVMRRGVECVFTETSVPYRSIEALTASVIALGGNLKHCGVLYSDSLGVAGSDIDSYEKIFEYNLDTIINGVLNEQ
jgi:manganese/zinc/iron transport system substrate-binding protein